MSDWDDWDDDWASTDKQQTDTKNFDEFSDEDWAEDADEKNGDDGTSGSGWDSPVFPPAKLNQHAKSNSDDSGERSQGSSGTDSPAMSSQLPPPISSSPPPHSRDSERRLTGDQSVQDQSGWGWGSIAAVASTVANTAALVGDQLAPVDFGQRDATSPSTVTHEPSHKAQAPAQLLQQEESGASSWLSLSSLQSKASMLTSVLEDVKATASQSGREILQVSSSYASEVLQRQARNHHPGLPPSQPKFPDHHPYTPQEEPRTSTSHQRHSSSSDGAGESRRPSVQEKRSSVFSDPDVNIDAFVDPETDSTSKEQQESSSTNVAIRTDRSSSQSEESFTGGDSDTLNASVVDPLDELLAASAKSTNDADADGVDDDEVTKGDDLGVHTGDWFHDDVFEGNWDDFAESKDEDLDAKSEEKLVNRAGEEPPLISYGPNEVPDMTGDEYAASFDSIFDENAGSISMQTLSDLSKDAFVTVMRVLPRLDNERRHVVQPLIEQLHSQLCNVKISVDAADCEDFALDDSILGAVDKGSQRHQKVIEGRAGLWAMQLRSSPDQANTVDIVFSSVHALCTRSMALLCAFAVRCIVSAATQWHARICRVVNPTSSFREDACPDEAEQETVRLCSLVRLFGRRLQSLCRFGVETAATIVGERDDGQVDMLEIDLELEASEALAKIEDALEAVSPLLQALALTPDDLSKSKLSR